MWKPKASKHADKGKDAEDVVKDVLEAWGAKSPFREWNRLIDTRAARIIIAAAKADFDFYVGFPDAPGAFGLIEVKETEHEYRLKRSHFPQFAGMRKREICGGTCLVLVFHSTLKRWRVASLAWCHDNGDVGSWDMRNLPLFERAEQALRHAAPGVF